MPASELKITGSTGSKRVTNPEPGGDGLVAEASAIEVTPSGDITADNVQDALEELSESVAAGYVVVKGLVSNATYVSSEANANDALLTAYLALGVALLIPEGTFWVKTAKVATASLIGTAPKLDGGTKFKQGVALSDAMLTFSCSGGRIENITFDGNNIAWYCIKILNANLGEHDSVTVIRAYYDGVHYPIEGNNLGVTWTELKALFCGHNYTTGTVSGTAGGTVITFTGAADLTTLGIRDSFDSVHFAAEIAADVAAGQLCGSLHDITVASATTANIYPPLTTNLSGAAFSINMGSGVSVGPHGINGSQRFVGPLFMQNADAGLRDSGLFGATVVGGIYEANVGTGRTLGRQLGTSARTAGGVDVGPHAEGGACGAYQYAYASRCTILPGGLYSSGGGNETPKFRVWPFSTGPQADLGQFRSLREMAAGTHNLLPELFSGRTGITTASCTVALYTNSFANFEEGEQYEIIVAEGNLTVISSGAATIDGPKLWGPGSAVKFTYHGAGNWAVTGLVASSVHHGDAAKRSVVRR
jgi:hypothetical protein